MTFVKRKFFSHLISKTMSHVTTCEQDNICLYDITGEGNLYKKNKLNSHANVTYKILIFYCSNPH